MITKNTVFVLGAGASKPYGYPTGAELRLKIATQFCDALEKLWNRINNDPEHVQMQMYDYRRMAKQFNASGISSIDKWMRLNPEHSLYAQRAIAFEILLAEQSSFFRESSHHPEQDWYTYLYNRLTEDFLDPQLYSISQNAVSFITFNYDRSLEQFLYESMLATFGKIQPIKLKEEFSKIPIVHIYGRLGQLKWENDSGTAYRIGPRAFFDHAKTLRVMYSERQPENDKIQLAQKLLSEAEQVFFLGFGYAEENLNILNVPSVWKHAQTIYGSAYKYLGAEVERSRLRVHKNGIGMKTILEQMDGLTLLRTYLE